MAKMIPGGAPDQSAFFLSRNAAASDALVRLYVSLLAKYNESRDSEDFKREMFDKGAGLQHELLDKRINAGNDPDSDGPDGASIRNGAHADPRDASTPPAAAAPVRQPQPSSTPLGTTPPLPSGKFSQGPDIQLSDEARNAFGQAPVAGITDRRIKPSRSAERPSNVLPGPAKGKNARTVSFVKGMDQNIIDHFEQTEQKYGLPRHTLMTVFGLENDGGRDAQRKGSVEGWFKFTDDLAKEYNLKPGDRQDIYKMADLAAMNMVRNNDELKRINNGVGLSNDPQDIPRWGVLHQFGHTNGPLFLKAHELNPNMPATAAMRPNKDPNVNYKTLVGNALNPRASVDELIRQQAGYYAPWTNEAFKQAGDRPVKPMQPVNPAPGATPPTGTPNASAPTANTANDGNVPPFMQRQPTPAGKRSEMPGENAYAQGGSAGSEVPFGQKTVQTTASAASASAPPRPPANVPTRGVIGDMSRTRGVNPRLIRAVVGGAELALPDGYTVHATSGVRHRGTGSYHDKRQAADFQIYRPDGTPIPNSGPDTTGLYTRMARGVKTWVAENDPGADRYIGYGGAFGSNIRTGGGGADTMHYDWGGSRGRLHPEVQFARLRPLAAHERNAPAQPKVQLAGPMPAKELPKLPPGVVRTEKNLYEPDKKQHTPAEGYTPAGQFPPTYFGAQPASTTEMNAWGNFRDTKAFGNKHNYITPPNEPTILARSGAPEFEMPMPPPRPDTESGDLEYGTPATVTPPDPNVADSADSMLIPMPRPNTQRPNQAEAPFGEEPAPIAPDEELNVPTTEPIAPNEELNVPNNDGLAALDVPLPLPRPAIPETDSASPDINTPDIQYPDAASANASVGGPDVAATQSSPPIAPPPQPKYPHVFGRLGGAIKNTAADIFNASKAVQDVRSGINATSNAAGAVANTAGDVAGKIGTAAGVYNTMQDSRQQSLEQIGNAIKEWYKNRRADVNSEQLGQPAKPSTMQTSTMRMTPKGPAPSASYNDPDARTPEQLKDEVAAAIFKDGKVPDDIPGKVKEWLRTNTELPPPPPPSERAPATATPPAAPKPAAPAKPAKPAAAPNPNAFTRPKMMPDGVTPWLPNTQPHHIKPPPGKKQDLLDINAPVKTDSGSTPSKIPPAPGKKPMPNAEVQYDYNPQTGKYKPRLEQEPVNDPAPIEAE